MRPGREAFPDLLAGLAPAGASSCARCGGRAVALASGRARVEFCTACARLELLTPEGLTLYSLEDRDGLGQTVARSDPFAADPRGDLEAAAPGLIGKWLGRRT